MIRLTLERSPREDALPLEAHLAKALGLPMGSFDYEIRKRSLDARRGKAKFVYTIDIFANGLDEEKLAKQSGGVIASPETEYSFPSPEK